MIYNRRLFLKKFLTPAGLLQIVFTHYLPESGGGGGGEGVLSITSSNRNIDTNCFISPQLKSMGPKKRINFLTKY